MENPLNITALNDFIFCPISIYFHGLYNDMETMLYQSAPQINGKAAHQTIDSHTYSGSACLQSLDVYCEKYNLIGKIDLYDKKQKCLIERKKKVKTVYDGYVFQLYAQYFAMCEMGYDVHSLTIRSMDDNKNYSIDLPENNKAMFLKFEDTLRQISEFDINSFEQNNREKCKMCIYSPYCDRNQNA